MNGGVQTKTKMSKRGRMPSTQRGIRDQLNREELVTGFCEELIAEPDRHVSLVNGEWGSGKTFFLEHCAQHWGWHNKSELQVVKFNAWRQSYLKNPVLDLVYCISADFERKSKRSIRSIAKRAARNIVMSVNDAVAVRTMGILDIRKVFNPDKNPWKDAQSASEELRKQLRQAAEKRRIVVLVDELDRCEPLYALQLIDTARHVLDVPNLQVVIAVNQMALEQSIQHTYGNAYDAERYLRRFVDSALQLPPPPANVVAGYIGTRLRGSERIPEYVHESGSPVSQMLATAILSPTRSIRDVDVAVPLVEKVLAMVDNQHNLPEEREPPPPPILAAFAVILITLRLASPTTYRRLSRNPTSGLPAWRSLNEDLGGWFHLNYTEPKTIEYMHTLFVHVVALGGTSAVGGVPSIRSEDVGPAIKPGEHF